MEPIPETGKSHRGLLSSLADVARRLDRDDEG